MRRTQVPGVRGLDKAKHIKRPKRHLLGETQGLALEVVVTAADVSESQGARLLFERLLRVRAG